MKDEIKEILDSIKYSVDEDDWFEIEGHFLKPLLDYITNLQERNNNLKEDFKRHIDRINELTERNKKAIEYIDKLLYFGIRNEEIDLNEIKLYLTDNDYIDITLKNINNYLEDYKSRNEKAIEYFKYQLEQLDFYEDTKAKMLCAMGIVILQGEDKDE